MDLFDADRARDISSASILMVEEEVASTIHTACEAGLATCNFPYESKSSGIGGNIVATINNNGVDIFQRRRIHKDAIFKKLENMGYIVSDTDSQLIISW